jgi:UDP-N-acetylmuramate dehydrogenase
LFAREKKLPWAVIGAGTNLLVLDRGFKGLVIKLAFGLNNLTLEKNRLRAGAGVLLPRLVMFTAAKGLGGIEFLAGIPGSVGGAVVMNAGAWGKEIGRFVEEVKVIDQRGEESVLRKKQLGFGYRRSRLQGGRLIITEITLKLKKMPRKAIREMIKDYLAKRRDGQPLGIPNCGSVFKNPKGDFAGRLIEAAGLKGVRVGDAQVSSKHANFIVNLGEAKAKDVIKLITRIRGAVKVKLEPEVRILLERPANP